MTRDELIGAMARAIANEIHECGDFGITGNEAYEVCTDDFKAQATAVLAAIEAQGLAIVPVEATIEMERTVAFCRGNYDAMIEVVRI